MGLAQNVWTFYINSAMMLNDKFRVRLKRLVQKSTLERVPVNVM